MTQRERESLATDSAGDSDPHSLLFGDDDDDGFQPGKQTRADRRRSEHSRRRRRHRRGWLSVLVAALLVAVVATFVTKFVINHFQVADYAGSGDGTVSITVPSGASAKDIGNILQKAGVVKSTQAFTDAADGNSKSTSIQPGRYQLREHMSGKAALSALLDPSSRSTNGQVVVIEGATSLTVAATLAKACGASKQAEIDKALKNPATLGLPVTYKVGSRVPSSSEGFLYPATYTPDAGCNPVDVLQKMVSRFIQQDRETDFARDAKKVVLTPYRALIVASIAQSEAKYAADMPKVVRTILNRLKADRPLQFDSTSSYACKLQNTKNCIYNQVDSPYNTYLNKGLPPTPIDNPGAEAMDAAVHPAAGTWLFFVNKDKAGHLFFTHDDKAFKRAAEKCVKNHWGCG